MAIWNADQVLSAFIFELKLRILAYRIMVLSFSSTCSSGPANAASVSWRPHSGLGCHLGARYYLGGVAGKVATNLIS